MSEKSKELLKFKVRMPISVEIGVRKKKKYFLNLNIYRNANMHVNNNIKKEYARIAHGVLPMVGKKLEQFRLHYVLYLPNKLGRDVANVLSIVDKAFCDAVVTHGIVIDDNYTYLKDVRYSFGGFDPKGKGYVDIYIDEKPIDYMPEIPKDEDYE